MSMRSIPHLLIAGVLALGLAACGGGTGSDVAGGGDEPTETPADEPTDQQDDGSSDETSMPADGDVEDDGTITQAEAEAVATAYLGLTEEEAEAQAEVDGRPYRVGARDGEQYLLTEDYVLGRITVEITDGVVTAATVEAPGGQVTVEG